MQLEEPEPLFRLVRGWKYSFSPILICLTAGKVNGPYVLPQPMGIISGAHAGLEVGQTCDSAKLTRMVLEAVMNALEQEVIKLMGTETTTTAEITDKLNRKGWGVKPDDVLDALHRLEVQRAVERLWRRKQYEAKPDVAVKKVASAHH